jgi:hypothetical protein
MRAKIEAPKPRTFGALLFLNLLTRLARPSSATLKSQRRIRHAKLRPAPFSAIQDQRTPASLQAAIMKLSNWVEQQGSAEVADNVRGALEAIDKNEELIKRRSQ